MTERLSSYRVDVDLLAAVKAKAKRNKMTVTAIIVSAFRDYLGESCAAGGLGPPSQLSGDHCHCVCHPCNGEPPDEPS